MLKIMDYDRFMTYSKYLEIILPRWVKTNKGLLIWNESDLLYYDKDDEDKAPYDCDYILDLLVKTLNERGVL